MIRRGSLLGAQVDRRQHDDRRRAAEVAAELPVEAEAPRHRREQRRRGHLEHRRAWRTRGCRSAAPPAQGERTRARGTSSNQCSVAPQESQCERPLAVGSPSGRRSATTPRYDPTNSPNTTDSRHHHGSGSVGANMDDMVPEHQRRHPSRSRRHGGVDVDLAHMMRDVVDRGAPPTCTSPSAGHRWSASTARCARTPSSRRDGRSDDRADAAHDDGRRARQELQRAPAGRLLRHAPRRQGRFRVNAYRQRGTPAAAFRAISDVIPTPRADRAAADASSVWPTSPYGLVLFVGPTGSGKSTTQAALIGSINAERHCHILTIEDPLEYLHGHGRGDGHPPRGRRRRAPPSPTACAPRCARTPTSCCSARCATPSRSPSR